jgi:glucose-6-phosphate 1-dehydrogenase
MQTPPPIDDFDLIVFGGNGDLALRKLMPALFELELDDRLPAGARIFAVARTETKRAAYIHHVEESCKKQVGDDRFDAARWQAFAKRLDYLALDATKPKDYRPLGERLAERDDVVRVFYLATSPELFGPITGNIGTAGLVTEKARVVLEKPLGEDLDSSRAISEAVSQVFAEGQTFRIDHYLGKETVQNLLVLRFANALFEPLWNNRHIDHVQITVAETVGVAGRWGYYDRTGALRDMMQNHLLQLLCLVAMEPPISLEADAVRDEKLKVLRSLRPITEKEVGAQTVRGQYRAGAIEGTAVPGYLEEGGGKVKQGAETFVALRANVDNWRWAGVPFYLRTGKRLPERNSEIVIQFREVPYFLFTGASGTVQPNQLIIRLQPDEGIEFRMMNKEPGPGGMRLRPVPLNLNFADAFHTRNPDAYERLLLDVVRGNATLFMRRDELEAAWRFIDQIRAGWAAQPEAPKPYAAGTWGPSAAVAMIERDGRTWHDETA